MGQVGNVYLNFALWALALVPGWLIIKEFGAGSQDKKIERESRRMQERRASLGEKSEEVTA